MIRTMRVRVLLPALLLPALLAGCGTEKAGAGTLDPPPAGPDRAELDARARALQIAPELVYVTEAPGFTLAQQSVGVYGGDGFSSVYWSEKTGGQIHLYVDRGTVTAESCAGCERDGDVWYRGGSGQHEYLLPEKGDVVVRVSADSAMITRAVLRDAATASHRPGNVELAALFPAPAPTATAPVERGDLPPVGDGAPNNEVGTTG
ncbi:hypothetical protein ACFYPC_03610 [Streptomyces sp. NPDC005808]|uniref:hypothetical protein n=1 Tax=Streptomyces sp. NPDC005808 TaxID=3364734 RepID=UPI0036C9919D